MEKQKIVKGLLKVHRAATGQFPPVAPLRGDVIVYTLQSTMADDAGRIVDASFTKGGVTEGNISKVVPVIVDMDDARQFALEKLDALDQLVLGL